MVSQVLLEVVMVGPSGAASGQHRHTVQQACSGLCHRLCWVKPSASSVADPAALLAILWGV